MINYGDWRETEKLAGSNAWQNPHSNAFGGMLRALDPMTYVPGVGSVSNAVHDVGGEVVTGLNTALSPIVKGTNDVLKTVSPGVQYLEDHTMMGGINRFVENKPADALALAAATFFSAGAASSAMGAGATAAAPAASGGAGAAGGMAGYGAAGSAALTPALSSGAVAGSGMGAGVAGSTTGSLVGASAITPALSSGAYGGIAGASGLGTLGTAGTAAATSALTPALTSLGTGASFMSKLKPMIDKAKTANSYKNSFSNQAMPDRDRINANAQADNLARAIVGSDSEPAVKNRITNQIVMNRFGMRK